MRICIYCKRKSTWFKDGLCLKCNMDNRIRNVYSQTVAVDEPDLPEEADPHPSANMSMAELNALIESRRPTMPGI